MQGLGRVSVIGQELKVRLNRCTRGKHTMSFSSTVRPPLHGNRQDGYVLITLILFVALLAIAMTALAPALIQQMKRDREEELIHRGVQYSRALKHYVKKFGRYPTKMEDLLDTNNVRFLRKAYKDPVTGKDFKILRMGDVQMSFGAGIAGATSAANLASQSSGFGSGNSQFASNFGGGGGGSRMLGGSSFGGNSFGGSFGGGSLGSTGTQASTDSTGANGSQVSAQDDAGTNSSQSQASAGATGATGTTGATGAPGTTAAPGTSAPSGQTGSDNQKVFGGGPIVGVASLSKDKSIRIFSKKQHYNEWQFVYDPSTDRGGLLATPNQPGLQSLAGAAAPGAPASQGTQPNSPFGSQGSPFGFQQGSPFGFQGGSQMSPGGMQPTQPAPSQQTLQPQFPPDQAPQ
jgi:type II secretory pathway pseudopilin PulG